jgi:hypothetical protein
MVYFNFGISPPRSHVTSVVSHYSCHAMKLEFSMIGSGRNSVRKMKDINKARYPVQP